MYNSWSGAPVNFMTFFQSRKVKLPTIIVRWIKFEYWPTLYLFFPAIIYALYLAIKARSLTYFTAANPGIEYGGFFGESKIDILSKINPDYLPKTSFFKKDCSKEQIIHYLLSNQFKFPLICKPNKGERGFLVKKIESVSELNNYLLNFNDDLIIQEFINFDIELGILFYRLPDDGKCGITSVVIKEFPFIMGNGIDTIGSLISNHDRMRMYKKKLFKQYFNKWNQIPDKGNKIILDEIGNHCRGTKFLNGEALINEKLVQVFDNIAKPMTGFYFGRFDLKVQSIEDLYNGTNIRIFEVNGTTSEPAHIYDPACGFWEAQRIILSNTKLAYKISRQNHARGVQYTPFIQVLNATIAHFKSKKRNDN